jgi:Zn finger protein HypA/HybF involved in hydrogenase expression
MTIEIKKLECRKCGHKWIPRKEDIHKCPRCQSRGWQGKKEMK